MGLPDLISRVTAPLRRLSSPSATKSVVAIDVGTTTVRALHVRSDGRELVLDGFRIVRGVGDDRALEQALREALQLRLGAEAVVVSIGSPEVAIRRIELPPMNARELREALPWEARRHIAGLADDAVLDVQVLKDGGSDRQSSPSGPVAAVLVAFPRKLYEAIDDAIRRLGVKAAFIDVGPLAAMNGLLANVKGSEGGPLALLELGAGLGWFSIFSASDLILFRDLGERSVQLDQTLASQFGLDPQQLEAFKLSGKVAKGEAPSPAALQRALAAVTTELAEDLRSALLYLESRSDTSLDKVHLSGPSAGFLERSGILELVSAQSGVTLERWNPLQRFRIGLVDEIGLRSAAAELAAAAGLASRFFQGG